MRSKTCLAVFFITFMITAADRIGAAELNENLSIFKDLIGRQWEGRFQGVDEPMVLYMNWEEIIDGEAVQMSGWSSPAGMTRRNIYYFDRAKHQVAFLAMTSNGYVATGIVQLKDSVLTFLGQQVFPDGSVRDTKSEWKFLPDGAVMVVGYSLEKGEWLPGHKILYNAVDPK